MNVVEELQKLSELRQSGAINDEEFTAAKARLLNGPASPPPLPGAPLNATGIDPATQEQQTRLWGLILHLSMLAGSAVPLAGYIAPIVIWQVRKDELPGIDAHGKNAVNWMISQLIYLAVGFVLAFVVIGVPIIVVVTLLGIIFPIVAAIKANQGETWKYPLTITFFE
jgi:uncharacterized Tic20 family protein